MTEPWNNLPLVDHHCHSIVDTELDRAGFEALLNAADGPSPGVSMFDTMLGLAVRRWCAPVLYLPAHVSADEYLARRAEVGTFEVNRRFLSATGITHFVLEGNHRPGDLLSTRDFTLASGGRVHESVQLERLAEDVVRAGTSAATFAGDCAEALAKAASTAVAGTSIAAHRVGLRLAGERPADADVEVAVGEWLSEVDRSGTARLASPVLHRFLIWLAVDHRLPLRIPVGYGDSDVHIAESDPLLLSGLLRATASSGVPMTLLHNYPFHRNAAYLAQVFPHVYLDLGLTIANVGYRSGAVITETLELAPFGKVMFSSGAFGLVELYHLGALMFRRGLSRFLTAGVAEENMTADDATRISRLICGDNALRVYRLT